MEAAYEIISEGWVDDEPDYKMGACYMWEVVLYEVGVYYYMIEVMDIEGVVAVVEGMGPLVGEKAEILLYPGWNFISLPLSPIVPYTAETLVSEIEEQGGVCISVQRWRDGGWETYNRVVHERTGVPLGDFPIKVGEGYFLYCEVESTFTLIGQRVYTITYSLEPGWNALGFPIEVVELTKSAEDLGHGIAEQNPNDEPVATRVQMWWAGMWKTYMVCMPFGNFSIEAGDGYFVYCKDSALFSPNKIEVTSVGKDYFTLTWITSSPPARCELLYGASPESVEVVAPVEVNGTTHKVTVKDLLPGTTYYYDILSNGTLDDNCGTHYKVVTQANGDLTASR
jgi:hypothetical protein